MDEEDMRYRVSAVVTSTLQIVVQARSVEEAEAFSDAIDFDKWSLVSSEYVTVDVAKELVKAPPAYRATLLLIRRGGTKSRLVSLFLLESFLTKLISN